MNSPVAYTPEEELSRLREQIDALDQELVEVLARRFRVTEAVSRLKASYRLSAVDPDRESMQAARLQRLAVQHEVSPEIVSKIFRAIVEQVVANHHAVAAQLSSEQPSP
jgi:chorismate mutase